MSATKVHPLTHTCGLMPASDVNCPADLADPERAPQLGAARPATGAGAPVHPEGLDGGRVVLRRAGRRRPTRLPRAGRQLRHRQPDPVLGELRRFLGGEKATLLWNGLPAHRSTAMRAWLASPAVLAGGRAAARLRTGAEPGCGPVVSLKAVELANLTSPTLAEVIDQAHQGLMTHQADTLDPLLGRMFGDAPADGRYRVVLFGRSEKSFLS
jgi:hypothetical protein